MKYFLNLACSNLRIKHFLWVLLGGSFFFQFNVTQAQTQDTMWYSIPTSTSYVRGTTTFSLSGSSFSLSSTQGGSSTNSTNTTTVYYSVNQMVDDVLVNQVSGSNLNYTYSWQMVRWNTGVAVNFNGISSSQTQYFQVGIVITVDDIRENPILMSKMPAELAVYPNPCENVLNLKLEGYEPNNLEMNIMNVQGEVVYRQSIMAFEGESTQRVSLGHLSPGYYFLSLQGRKRIVKPIQIIR